MSLLEELNDKRQRVLDDIAIVDQDVETARQTLASAVADRASLDEKLADLDLAISALTPPLQHKGGETEVGSRLAAFKERFQGFIKADLPEGYIAWEGGACPAEISDPIGPVPYVELKFSDGDTHGTRLAHTYNWTGKSSDLSIEPHIIGYRIFSSSEVDSGPRSEAPAGDARIEQTISTLQASSGEGETTVSELGAADVDSVDAQTAGATLPDGGQESPDLLQESRCSVAGCEIHGTPPIDATEPAAYSPVNNADEPVTKPEADFFAQAIIPVQSGIEFSVDGGPKQATGAAKLFGGIFAKREVV